MAVFEERRLDESRAPEVNHALNVGPIGRLGRYTGTHFRVVLVGVAGGGDRSGSINVDEEYEQNQERYTFLKWAARSFENFRVVPPGTGICHQVNLEYLSQTVWTGKDKVKVDGKR